MLHCHPSDHISTSTYSMPAALCFTLSSPPLLLLRTLIRPLIFCDSSSIFLVLISSNKACSKLLLSHDLQQDCLHRLVVHLVLRVLFHNHFSCMSPFRENLVEVARLVRLGRRQVLRFEVDETIGVPIATLVNHLPHQLHHFVIRGLDHARMELAIAVGSQVTFQVLYKGVGLFCDGLAVCVIMDVYELLLALDLHFPTVLDNPITFPSSRCGSSACPRICHTKC